MDGRRVAGGGPGSGRFSVAGHLPALPLLREFLPHHHILN